MAARLGAPGKVQRAWGDPNGTWRQLGRGLRVGNATPCRRHWQGGVTAKRRLGGKPVHADGEFKDLAPALRPSMPECSPVRAFGGYQKRASAGQPRQYAFVVACGCGKPCAVHGHGYAWALLPQMIANSGERSAAPAGHS